MRMNKKKEIVPKLRFPEFDTSEGWKKYKLRELADRITKKVGDNKLVTLSISAGIGFVSQAEKFSRDISGKQYCNYIYLKKGEFSYNKGNSKTFPQGCIYELKEYEEAAVPNAFISFRFKENLVPSFYQGYFDSNFHGKQLVRFITSGARSDGLLNISPTDFFSIVLPTPVKKEEQQKIADCLSSIDELIDAESRKLKALEKHKKGLMQKLFPAEGKTVPEWRFPEFQGCGEWKLQKLKLICDFQEGYAFSSSDFVANDTDSNYIQVVRITDINNKNSNTDKVFVNMDLIKRNDLYKYLISKNDLILSLTGAAGFNFFIWNTNIAVLNQRTLKLIPKDEKNHAIKFLIEPLIHKEINMHGTGQNNNLSKEVLKNVEIVLPTSFKEQQKIADCLSEIDKIITEQSNKVEQLKAHKKGLMQGLFPSLEEADV